MKNLRWASLSEQIQHSYATNTNRGSNAFRQSKPVKGRKIGDKEWIVYPSGQEAGRKLNLDGGSIRTICRGERKTIHGYEFEFAEPNEPASIEEEEWADVK